MRLQNKAAFVTGGASGIGEAICAHLVNEGARVVIGDIAEDAGKEAAARLSGAAGAATAVEFVRIDLADADSVPEAVAHAERTVGAPDVLVNCAGADVIKPFLETDETFWRWLVDLNLMGSLRTTKAVLPGMVERGQGRIVNIASDAARVGSSGEAVYSACKGGLISFTKSIAREVASSQVTVNAVCPGPTDTPATQRTLEGGGDKLIKALTRAVPLGRLGAPEDVAAMVAFLASDEAAFITGQTVSVSGGLSMC